MKTNPKTSMPINSGITELSCKFAIIPITDIKDTIIPTIRNIIPDINAGPFNLFLGCLFVLSPPFFYVLVNSLSSSISHLTQ